MMAAKSILAAFRHRSGLASAYDDLYRTPQGKMVIDDLLKRTGLLEVSHVIGDPASTSYRDGRRSIGLEIIDAMRWTEGKLVELSKEQSSERVARAEEQFETESI